MRALFRFLDSPAGRVLRYCVSFLLVAGFVALIDWSQLSGLQGQFEWNPVIWGTILAGLAVPLHAWRWWLLYRSQGLTLSFRWAHVVTWIGHFYNAVLLGGLGGDAARAVYICRDAPQQKSGGLASIAMDRVMGLLVLLVIIVVTAAAKLRDFTRVPELHRLAIASLLALIATGIVGGALLWLPPSRWPQWLRQRIGNERIGMFMDLHRRTHETPGAHTAALVLTVAIWLADFVSVWLLAVGLGFRLPFLETCIAVSVAYAATVLPVSVGGHGIREGALLFTLGAFGLVEQTGPSRESALLLAVLVWVVTMVWSLAGGVVLLAIRPHAPVR